MSGMRLLVAIGLLGVATMAGAQSKKEATKFAVPGSPDSAAAGSKGPAPRRRATVRARADAAVATFPGFRLLPDGSSRIYVELTRQIAVDERRAGAVLVYRIHDARVLVRNNRNALITTHFPTPVGRARLIAAGPDLELVIDLRKSASATHRVVAAENGGVRLEVDFPPGDYPPAPRLFEPAKRGASPEGEEPAGAEASPPQGARSPAGPTSNGAAPPPAPAAPTRAAPSSAPPSAAPSR